MAGAVGAADASAVELVELSCVAIAEGRMAASRADVMVAFMAACGVRELGDEVDEDRA